MVVYHIASYLSQFCVVNVHKNMYQTFTMCYIVSICPENADPSKFEKGEGFCLRFKDCFRIVHSVT